MKTEVSANPPSEEISTKHLLLFNNTLGSGFRWNIADRLYFKYKIGIGPQISKKFVKFETDNNESITQLNLSFSYSLGFGFRF